MLYDGTVMVTTSVQAMPPSQSVPCELYAIVSSGISETFSCFVSFIDPNGTHLSISKEKISLNDPSGNAVDFEVTSVEGGRSQLAVPRKPQGVYSLTIFHDGRDIASLFVDLSAVDPKTSKLLYLNQAQNVYCEVLVHAAGMNEDVSIEYQILDANLNKFGESSKPSYDLSFEGPNGLAPLVSRSAVSSLYQPMEAGNHTLNFSVRSLLLPELVVPVLGDVQIGKDEKKEIADADVSGMLASPSAAFTSHPIAIPFKIVDCSSGSSIDGSQHLAVKVVSKADVSALISGIIDVENVTNMRYTFTTDQAGEYDVSLYYKDRLLSHVVLDVLDLSLSLIGSIQSSPTGFVGRSHRVTGILTNTLTNEQVPHLISLKFLSFLKNYDRSYLLILR